MSDESPISQVPPPPRNSGNPSQTEYDRTPRWKKILEIAAVVIGATYTTIAFFQLRATLKVMRADQRAWVNGQGGDHLRLEVGKQIAQPFLLANIGRTPARNVYAVYVIDVLNVGDEPSFDYSNERKSETLEPVMFPGRSNPIALPLLSSVPGTKIFEPTIMTKELSDKYHAGQIWFVIYGSITYDDVFDVSHWVHACLPQVAPDASGFIGKVPSGALRCIKYNQVDDN